MNPLDALCPFTTLVAATGPLHGLARSSRRDAPADPSRVLQELSS